LLLLVTGKLDSAQQRSKWLSSLEGAGVLVQVWPLDAARLPQWIRQRMQARELQPATDALALLADRVQGNLLAADQELEKLRLLYGPGAITLEQVQAAVTDSARFDVFQLVDTALAGQSARAVRILFGLREEGVDPVLVLWALARELRQLVQMAEEVAGGQAANAVLGRYRVWERRKRPVLAALQRLPAAATRALLRQCHHADRVIKGQAAGRAWDELLELTQGLAARPAMANAAPARLAHAGR
jgi:DNA polymerase-3 subunit delta